MYPSKSFKVTMRLSIVCLQIILVGLMIGATVVADEQIEKAEYALGIQSIENVIATNPTSKYTYTDHVWSADCFVSTGCKIKCTLNCYQLDPVLDKDSDWDYYLFRIWGTVEPDVIDNYHWLVTTYGLDGGGDPLEPSMEVEVEVQNGVFLDTDDSPQPKGYIEDNNPRTRSFNVGVTVFGTGGNIGWSQEVPKWQCQEAMPSQTKIVWKAAVNTRDNEGGKPARSWGFGAVIRTPEGVYPSLSWMTYGAFWWDKQWPFPNCHAHGGVGWSNIQFKGKYAVRVTPTGLQSGIYTTVYIDDSPKRSLYNNQEYVESFWQDTTHKVEVDEYAPNEHGQGGMRCYCQNNTKTIGTDNRSSSLVFDYVTQYFLDVSSPHDTPRGTGWYDSGDYGYASLDSTRDGDYVFDHWEVNGVNRGSDNPLSIYINGPKTAQALWRYEPPPSPSIAKNKTNIAFVCPISTSDTFQIWNDGTGTLSYTVLVTSGSNYFSVTPSGGTSTGSTDKETHEVTVDCNDILSGETVSGTITISSSNADDSPQYVNLSASRPSDPNAFFEDFETCDFSRHSWQQGGEAPWKITSDAYAGSCAARSGVIVDNQQSSIEVTKNVPTGYITFRQRVSSELQYDRLTFYIDDCLAGLWSGEKDWAKKSYFIEEGTHTFKWAYEKDVSLSSGSDCGWIDDIVFEPEPVDCALYCWADFHANCTLTSCMTVTPTSYFAYDWYYEDHWLIYGSGGGFTATFNSPADRQFELVVRHLSSASAGCPGGGYSPVTIKLNGDNIVSCYDPAENHGGTHGFVTDTWLIPVTAGTNTLEWIACDLCTNYWIQGIEIRYPKELEGDLDCDSVVYFNDVGMLTAYWLEDCATPNWCGGRDIDKSGSVNFTDFAELSNHWLQATTP